MVICLKCGPKEDSNFYDYQKRRKSPKCKECVKQYVKDHYAELKKKGLCNDCGEPTDGGHRLCMVCRKKRLKKYHANPEANRKATIARRKLIRLEAFNAYGGPFCACCSEAQIEFLTFDHINGGGSEHRRQIAKDSGWKDPRSVRLADWLKKSGFPPGFQVLCFNCNFAKGHSKDGLCPHQRINFEQKEVLPNSEIPAVQ